MMNEAEGAECCYCGAFIELIELELVPAVDDDDAWEGLALAHECGCEWIWTRAHRLPEDR